MTKRDFIFLALLWLISIWPVEVPSRPDAIEVANTYSAIATSRGEESIEFSIARHGKISRDLLTDTSKGRVTKMFPAPAWLGGAGLVAANQVADVDAWDLADTLRFLRTWVFLPIALIGFVLIRRILGALGTTDQTETIASIMWFAGTATLQLGSAVLAHQLIATAMLAVIDLSMMAEYRLFQKKGTINPLMAVAGLLASLILASDVYAVGYVVALFFFVAGGPLARRTDSISVYVGMTMPGVVVWFFSAQSMFESLAALPLPNLDSSELVVQAFVSGGGLWATTPLFVLSISGLLVLARQKRSRIVVLVAVSVATSLASISAQIHPTLLGFAQAGLVPCLPLLAISMAAGLDGIRGKRLTDGVMLGLFSSAVFAQALMWVFSPNIPRTGGNLLADEIPMMLSEALVPSNRGMTWFELEGFASLAIYALAVAALILVPVVLDLKGRPKSKLALVLGLAIAVGVLHLGLLSNFGGQWTQDERKEVKTAIDKIKGHNEALGKRAFDAVHRIDGMDK